MLLYGPKKKMNLGTNRKKLYLNHSFSYKTASRCIQAYSFILRIAKIIMEIEIIPPKTFQSITPTDHQLYCNHYYHTNHMKRQNMEIELRHSH